MAECDVDERLLFKDEISCYLVLVTHYQYFKHITEQIYPTSVTYIDVNSSVVCQ